MSKLSDDCKKLFIKTGDTTAFNASHALDTWERADDYFSKQLDNELKWAKSEDAKAVIEQIKKLWDISRNKL